MAVRLTPRVWCCDLEERAPEDGLVIRQRPSRAFGNGRHPTTKMSARALHYFVTVDGAPRVLDVGAGTGVLSRLARKAGSTRVCGVEIDPHARRAFRNNLFLDDAPIEVRADIPPEVFDVVVANILEEVLLDLRVDLVRALAPRGRLLLSGFTREQTPRLIAAFTALGLVRRAGQSRPDANLVAVAAQGIVTRTIASPPPQVPRPSQPLVVTRRDPSGAWTTSRKRPKSPRK